MKNRISIHLFITAYIQVFLVAANTYFISQLFWIGIAVASFGISYTWASNVKKISIGNKLDRLVYSIGAMCGGLSGVFISKIIL